MIPVPICDVPADITFFVTKKAGLKHNLALLAVNRKHIQMPPFRAPEPIHSLHPNVWQGGDTGDRVGRARSPERHRRDEVRRDHGFPEELLFIHSYAGRFSG